jgi:hypothetical protein
MSAFLIGQDEIVSILMDQDEMTVEPQIVHFIG